ncbi:hypothetical protein M404DRAFT_513097 [Pisolithus tinctorius Marx 270]|uniref:Uncharacterized protein n=1 Tax=Pisolithus tinctorius Marx 270 TaxID=870435 RepID=A0A0C3PCZ2_PISTI|nr:hypothetical protein M404DRAFT_513097 [Pisolithus tinctorius Marx 270]
MHMSPTLRIQESYWTRLGSWGGISPGSACGTAEKRKKRQREREQQDRDMLGSDDIVASAAL